MSSAKKSSAPGSGKQSKNSSKMFSGWWKGVVLGLLTLGIMGGGAYLVWRQVGDKVLSSREHYFGPPQIAVSPQPPWIRADLRAEVYNDLNRDGPPSILDENLVDRVREAFSRHPWVARVDRVSKQNPPPLVMVELIYRQPVCMVELPMGLMPVDAEGTLLPTTIGSTSEYAFTPVEAAKYPKLVGVDRGPMGAVGARWGDSRVVGGAEIAKALLPLWDKLKLEKIVPLQSPELDETGVATASGSRRLGEYQYMILAGGGRVKIIWGTSPDPNIPGEVTVEEKVKKLERIYAEVGALDSPQAPKKIDLRQR